MPRFNSLEPRLHIADFAKSVAFYRDRLGFEVLSTFPEDTPSFALLSRDGVGLQIGGIDTAKRPANPPTPPSTSGPCVARTEDFISSTARSPAAVSTPASE